MRRTLVGVFVVALLLTDAGSALASTERIDACEVSGSSFPGCDASGTVMRPRQLRLRFWSHQTTDFAVDWMTVCFKWSVQEGMDGSFSSSGVRINRRIGMGFWRPRRCEVEASITGPLGEGGVAKLILLARV